LKPISGRCPLANTKSAKKRIRANERRRQYNLRHRSRARSEVKKARAALAQGDPQVAEEAVREAVSHLDHAASKGTLHKNNASRRKGRLMKQLARLKAQQ
jgi:small subunit ribosomal protein S20